MSFSVSKSVLPPLYPEPLPGQVNSPAYLKEKLRRVTRRYTGSVNARQYYLIGEAGRWSIFPEDYYTRSYKAEPGRKGPWQVQEQKVHFKIGEPRQFDSEIEAWEWIKAEHAARVDARLAELTQAKISEIEAKMHLLEQEMAAQTQLRDAWKFVNDAAGTAVAL